MTLENILWSLLTMINIKILEITQIKENPFFVYNLNILESNYNKLKIIWGKHQKFNINVYYSLKSNPHPQIINKLNQLGSHFDASSYNELILLEKLNIDAKKISISGPAKTEKLVDKTKKMGVHALHIDSLQELKKINNMGIHTNTLLTLRLAVKGALWKKLGMSSDTILKILRTLL